MESFSGRETRESADHVASALRAWHEAGAASGDLAFWRERAEQFRSRQGLCPGGRCPAGAAEPRGLDGAVGAVAQPGRPDPAGRRRLFVPQPGAGLDARPVGRLRRRRSRRPRPAADLGTWSRPPQQRWTLARKFLDYLEANAEEYWEVPRFELAGEESAGGEEEDDEVDDIYGAAYEGVTFRGSTEDDVEGEMLEGGDTGGEATDFELVEEAERIVGRLTFLATLAQLWKLAAVASFGSDLPAAEREPVLAGWLDQATEEPAAASRLAGRGLSLPHSAAARHARGPGGIRTPPQRQGDAAGADHRHLRGDGRRRAADPRGHGPPQPGRRPRGLGRAGRSGAEGRVARRSAGGAKGLAAVDRRPSASRPCCTWPWPAAVIRSGSSPRGACRPSSAACWPTCRGWASCRKPCN